MTQSTEPFRRMLAALVVVAVAFSLGFTTSGPTPAQAHDESGYFVGKWAVPSQVRYSLGNTYNVSRSGLASAAAFGASTWNDVSGSTVTVSFDRNDSSVQYEDAYCRSGYHNIWVFGMSMDNGLLAQASRCTEVADKAYLTSARIRFDTNRNWYWGSGTPAQGVYDGRGIAVHEFGHTLGFRGHWPKPSTLCADPTEQTDHTMCPSVRSGWTHFRTLATHDRHTMANAY